MRARDLICLLAAIFLTGCGGPKPATLEGEVFIVTKGSQVIRLPLVDVRIIEAGDIQHIRDRQNPVVAPETKFAEFQRFGQVFPTNSEGRFHAQVPAGRYALVAHSERQVGREVEQYFWVEPVDCVQGQTLQVNLTNRNVYDGEPLPLPKAFIRQ